MQHRHKNTLNIPPIFSPRDLQVTCDGNKGTEKKKLFKFGGLTEISSEVMLTDRDQKHHCSLFKVEVCVCQVISGAFVSARFIRGAAELQITLVAMSQVPEFIKNIATLRS